MQFHNTLSSQVEEFTPISSNNIKMYVCGITPYDRCHLGHARCYVVFDTIRRYFEYSGYNVEYVQNFTDIDDKIINRSKELNIGYKELAEKFIDDFFENCKKINIKPASEYPRVSQHIPEILATITRLVEKGYAYAVEGDVYYSVKKFEGYGKLSKRNTDDLLVGARIAPGEKKRDPLDFALWKASKPEEPSWDSPWGKGRPGWHIECSAMSLHEIGTETLDIHGGGQDLIFPHHENEIAQSEAATGKPFANYWIHNGFVTINKEKMSKSLGNFFALSDIFAKYAPPVVRLFLISQHYRTPLDFSDNKLEQAKNGWERITRAKEIAENLIPSAPEGGLTQFHKNLADEYVKKFTESMNNDFNTSEALAALHGLVNQLYSFETDRSSDINKSAIKYSLSKLTEICGVLGFILPSRQAANDEIMSLVQQRLDARKNKDFAKADEIRKKIDSLGYVVEDTPSGPRVRQVNVK
ncbi:MAG: cysteine--tRNA ligase [Elusimicrobia bacterium RIFOXYB2_FULL_48_7]|nr:MAG: cysteine--tRNA ligase [Elusimicrobia bacterium RIFOXYB2_FULL_48_7]